MKKKNLTLEDLRVNSFVIDEDEMNSKTVQGGGKTTESLLSGCGLKTISPSGECCPNSHGATICPSQFLC